MRGKDEAGLVAGYSEFTVGQAGRQLEVCGLCFQSFAPVVLGSGSFREIIPFVDQLWWKLFIAMEFEFFFTIFRLHRAYQFPGNLDNLRQNCFLVLRLFNPSLLQHKPPGIDLNPTFLYLSDHTCQLIVHSILEEQPVLIAHISILFLQGRVDGSNFPFQLHFLPREQGEAVVDVLVRLLFYLRMEVAGDAGRAFSQGFVPLLSFCLERGRGGVHSSSWVQYQSGLKLLTFLPLHPHNSTPPNPSAKVPLIAIPYHIITFMSRKLKFKIISCSSQEPDYPVSSLLFTGASGWQTRRFCTYPQQITLQFYGVVNVRKLQFHSDQRKIASQIDILYYVPTGSQEQRFYKYGFLNFSKIENKTREEKVIMVDINCLYLRFLFHKPYPSKENFFSQIGLHLLGVYGSEQPNLIMQEPTGREDREEGVNEEDEEFVGGYMTKLSAAKEDAIRQENFDLAEYYKNTMVQISNFATKLREHRIKIARSVETEDFDTAKKIKEQIDIIKREIQQILEDKAEDENPPHPAEEEENEFAQPPQDQNSNEFMQPQANNFSSLPNSKVSNKMANSRAIKPKAQYREDYDERVIPALRSDRIKSQPQQQGEQRAKELPGVQQVQGKYIKQATFMQQFFNEDTVKKFFSQYWQYNLESLNNILTESKKKHRDAGLVKCLVSVVKLSIKQTNFQVSLVCLGVLQEMLKINAESQSVTKPGDMQNDLDEIGREVIKKMTDNNPKIKTAADQTFALMVSSLLYGVEGCSIALTKNKAKLSSKQLSTRLAMVSKMIDDYGLASGPNTVPLTALDFAIQNLNHSAQQVRKNAVQLLATAYRRQKNKTQIRISDLKDSIIRQIRGQQLAQTPPRNKKK